ncbi:transcriptional regulator, MarR family [Herbiconiux ginsengi]|uniref:Transcriptional regulator, MarR family n=2 Tax=Herbiconiux ginsengi TaxID=381665 RepID=A0A1H3T6N9_9MICO|nr:transcriptional regulator, MarR family [Herbiconiux ginsengi]
MYARHFPEVDPEPYLLGVAVQRMAATMRLQMDARVYQPAGVSIAHVRILIALATVGSTTPSELARFTQVSPSSVSSVLRTLRRNGHVAVDSPDDSADGRVKLVRILPAGERAMTELMSEMTVIESEWASVLSAVERRKLIAILRTMASGTEGVAGAV